jgi:hypothetical protein
MRGAAGRLQYRDEIFRRPRGTKSCQEAVKAEAIADEAGATGLLGHAQLSCLKLLNEDSPPEVQRRAVCSPKLAAPLAGLVVN